MIDYFGHAAVLNVMRERLKATPLPTPAEQAIRDETVTAVEAEPDAALLGSMLDHIIMHASSDGRELALLRRAADTWKQAIEIYDDVTTARASLEKALLNPSAPASLAEFATAMQIVGTLETRVTAAVTSATHLTPAISPPRYLKGHSRQKDAPLKHWRWDEIFLSRGTEVFTRALVKASATPQDHAFTFGAISAYAGNVVGGAWIGQAVGGPPRLHPYRSRLARYAVGSALRSTKLAAPDLKTLAARLRWGNPALPPKLPQQFQKLIETALTDTYPAAKVPPAPNLQKGYRRLLRHIDLLQAFQMPPLPAPLAAPLYARKLDNPDAFPPIDTGVKPQAQGSDPPPDSLTIGSGDTEEKRKKTCLEIFLIVLAVIALVVLCVLTLGAACGGKGSSSSSSGTASSEDVGQSNAALTTFAASDEAVHIADVLQQFQTLLWQAMSDAADHLAITGLIYPDDDRLHRKPHSQFLSMPAADAGPRRALPDPAHGYESYPSTQFEMPLPAIGSQFPIGTSPATFLMSLPMLAGPTLNAADWGVSAWIAAIQTGDGHNKDMTADRGALHPCWDVGTGSISDDPIDVVVLGYGQIAL